MYDDEWDKEVFNSVKNFKERDEASDVIKKKFWCSLLDRQPFQHSTTLFSYKNLLSHTSEIN
ncbi:hypothetical protein BLOT_014803 [Blomia tropicalis]|nr:hypothetical protein BLOT_014803 [Blomia tropicalis]